MRNYPPQQEQGLVIDYVTSTYEQKPINSIRFTIGGKRRAYCRFKLGTFVYPGIYFESTFGNQKNNFKVILKEIFKII